MSDVVERARVWLRDVHRGSAAEIIPDLLDEFRAEWAADRQRVADRWFGGDTDRADDVLHTLPWGEIPDWGSLDRVMEAINQSGDPK